MNYRIYVTLPSSEALADLSKYLLRFRNPSNWQDPRVTGVWATQSGVVDGEERQWFVDSEKFYVSDDVDPASFCKPLAPYFSSDDLLEVIENVEKAKSPVLDEETGESSKQPVNLRDLFPSSYWEWRIVPEPEQEPDIEI